MILLPNSDFFKIKPLLKSTSYLAIRCLIPLLLFLTLILITVTGCQQRAKLDESIPHYTIQNDQTQNEQDLSEYFRSKTIIVQGEDAKLIPGKVRHFEYHNNILYLIRPFPKGTITAIEEDGKVKWQLSADSDPLTSFSRPSKVFIDEKEKIIKVFDDQKHIFYFYDLGGKFLKREQGPKMYINDLFFTQEETLLFSVTALENEFEVGKTGAKAALVMFDEGNNGINPDRILSANHYYNVNSVPYLDFRDFFLSDDKIFYHQDFNDTLFQFNNNGLLPGFIFSFDQNDKRKEALLTPNRNPITLQYFRDENIPRTNFMVPHRGYILASYVYNGKAFFTMINQNSKETILNTQNAICANKRLSGRLDYSNGVLLNQMYLGNYNELQTPENRLGEAEKSKYQDGDFVYTILSPQW